MRSKNDYLDFMGIQRWRASGILPGALDPVVFSSWVLVNIETHVPTAVLRLGANSLGFEQGEIEKLLDAMLAAVQLKRDAVVQNNEAPQDLLHIIMGDRLAQKLLKVPAPMDTLQAQNTERLKGCAPILVTYHPEMLLADPTLKRRAWEDLKRLLDK